MDKSTRLTLPIAEEPVIVVPLLKGWSDEARAAAIAARQAKAKGQDPKAAAETAKALVREGKDPKAAAAAAVKGGKERSRGFLEKESHSSVLKRLDKRTLAESEKADAVATSYVKGGKIYYDSYDQDLGESEALVFERVRNEYHETKNQVDPVKADEFVAWLENRAEKQILTGEEGIG